MKNTLKRLLSLVLVLALCAGFMMPVNAVGMPFTVEKVDNSLVSASIPREQFVEAEQPADYADTDMVRVSIVLKEKSTLEAAVAGGISVEDIASDETALQYRAELEAAQADMAAAISAKALSGEKLDVVWNLTLAANIISANVQYGKIEAIKAVNGVADVLIETRYEPAVVDTDEAADPNMSTSGKQIGSNAAWAAGYTGAGSRVAIIDTGTDTNHQSFSAEAFEYSLSLMDADYVAGLDLLDAEEIAKKAELLNVTIDPEMAFINSKVAFGYNYIDGDYDVLHINDTASEHGSHVSGIAAANAYIPAGDGFVPAMSSVMVQGVAPDAQILTMKVFGKNGGAYDSDYMAAIEDAVILGADSVNLSLGSGNPGSSRNTTAEYQAIMESLVNCGVVVVMSAGNAGYWSESAYNLGYLYADDVSMQTDGTPGSFTNSLTVASVDNDGTTGLFVQVGNAMAVYSETDYSNEPLATLAGDHEFVMIEGIGTPEDFAAVADVLEGKIALCYRGTTSFFEKAEAAVEAGAIATVVCNNQAGIINMDLTDYSYTEPVVSITQADAAAIKANATAVTDDEGNVLYYTGTMTVGATVGAAQFNSDYYTMSSFSSWGVPGSLELKPEVTAPGGSIYSVYGATPDGGGSDKYEVMSGTSMAAPQVAGMAALVAQYIRENGLDEKTGVNARTLAQSLLMSTAVPMVDGNSGTYYPVMQQGAGLANVGAAVSADSYIMMAEDANAGAADGKVKVELGDDPARVGQYTFSFTIHNLTDEEKTYVLSSDLFTQNLIYYYANGNMSMAETAYYMDTWCLDLEGAATFTVNGEVVESDSNLADLDVNADGSVNEADGQAILDYATGTAAELANAEVADVDYDGDVDSYDAYLLMAMLEKAISVPANGAQEIQVTLTLSEMDMAVMDYYYENGAYVEGYVFAESLSSEEGVEGTCHSIPVLGFYGNWSDPSMFDRAQFAEYATGEAYELPYLGKADSNTYAITYADEPDAMYYFGGNPMVPDAVYMPERNAINAENGDMITRVQFTNIRNAAASFYQEVNYTTGEVYRALDLGEVDSAYYYVNGGVWRNTNWGLKTAFAPEAAEGDQLELAVTLVPEYYVDAEGNVNWDALGDGVTFAMPMVVDNTAPAVNEEDIVLDLENLTLTVPASDNQYISAVALYNRSGSNLYAYTGAKQDIQPGEEAEFVLDLSNVNGRRFLLQVTDYAMNTVTYLIEQQIGSAPVLPDMIAYDMNQDFWTALTMSSKHDDLTMYAPSEHEFYGATIKDGYVFACTPEGNLYVMPQDDLMDVTLVGSMGVVLDDLAYNPVDEKLYGIDDGVIYSVDALTAETTLEADVSWFFRYARHLAIDADGTFYTVTGTSELGEEGWGFGANDVCKFRLEDVKNEDYSMVDWVVWYLENEDGSMPDSYHVSGFEVNLNTNKLVWASYYQFSPNSTFGTSVLYEMVLEDGVYDEYRSSRDLWNQLSALIIPVKGSSVGAGTWDDPTDTVSGVQLDRETMTVIRGSSKTLEACVQPWTASDRTVTWTSADESIATVDARGRVTGINTGTTTITATSNVDPSLSASCEVTVETVDVTLEGVLQDADGNPMLFSWNMQNTQWDKVQDIDTSVAAAAIDFRDNQLYVQDSSSSYLMHKINAETGVSDAVSGANGFGMANGDMANAFYYSTVAEAPLMMAAYAYYLLSPCDAMENTFNSGWNLADQLAFWTDASSFVALAYGGYTEYEGEMIDLFYALDDAGYLWELLYNGTGNLRFGQIATDLQADFSDYEGLQYSSMVYNFDDACFYVSAFNGETNELYQLSYDADQEIYASEYLGNVGQDVWPAVLTAAYVNPETDPEGVLRCAADELQSLEAVSEVQFKADMEAMNSGSLNTASAQAVRERVEPLSTGSGKDGVFTVQVTAKDADGQDVASTNGVINVSYDPSMVLESVLVHGDLVSVNDSEAGSVTVGYVNLEGAAAGETVATLVFSNTPASNDVTVTTVEVNNSKSGAAENMHLFKLAGTSMTLSNDLSMNFYVNKSDVTGEGWYAEIEHNGETTVVPAESWIASGSLLKITYAGIAAKEMADDVTVTVFDANGNVVSEVYVDSVRDYAMRMVGKKDMGTMMVDMLNYGAEAQLYFGYNTEDLANALLTDEQKALATESVELADASYGDETYMGTSLNLESRIEMNVFFQGAITGDMSAVVTYTDYRGNEVTVEKEVIRNNRLLKISIDELVLADARQPVTVELLNAEGEVVATAVDSVESYCARMSHLALTEPLMKFADSAKAFFTK